MERGTTLFLRGAILLIALAALAVCVFALPAGIKEENAGGYRFILAGMYVPALPFFAGVYQVLNLVGFIDKGQAFSELSVRALKNIKYCGASISALFAAGMPYIYIVAERDDAPGVIAIALVIILAAAVIALLAAVLQRLLQEALALKAENDLTV